LSNSEQPKSPTTLFLDATHQAKITAKLLRDAGISVEVHKRYFLADAPDPEWIADCTRRGWAIVSGDKGIEYDGVNRRAVATSRAKVFILADTTSRCVDWAASLVIARQKILKIVEDNEGPFFCTVEKGNDEHVGKVRFLEGGRPIQKVVSMTESQIAAPEPTSVPEESQVPKAAEQRGLFPTKE
jgi:hypothetical protein